MVISFRARYPVFQPDQEPGTVTIDVPKGQAVSCRNAKPIVIHKGEAQDRYSLPPGAWHVGPDWRVEVFRNGKNKPWSVTVRYRRPLVSVTVPDYQPPQPPKGPLTLVK